MFMITTYMSKHLPKNTYVTKKKKIIWLNISSDEIIFAVNNYIYKQFFFSMLFKHLHIFRNF